MPNRHSVGMTAFLALCGILFVSLPAQSYEGVIAPPESAAPASNSSAPKNDGYSGVVVPSDGKIAQPENGYGGYTPVERAPEMTLLPGASATPPALNSLEDLKTLSMVYAHDKDMDGVPDDLDTSFRLPSLAAKILAQPQYRENGMLPREVTTKRMIDYLMKRVKDSNPGKDRRENVKLAEESLKSLQKGMRAKKSIPPGVWQRMGVPDSYVQESRDGDEKSLNRISDALKELSKYE